MEPDKEPRQGWNLIPEKEKKLASRSFWIRGLGVGPKRDEIMPLLELTGSRPQRVRFYKYIEQDRFGQYACYVTYPNEEVAEVNYGRIGASTLNNCKVYVRKAAENGAYFPSSKSSIAAFALSKMTTEEKKQLIMKKKSAIKLNKIRQLNEKLRVTSNSPSLKRSSNESDSIEKKEMPKLRHTTDSTGWGYEGMSSRLNPPSSSRRDANSISRYDECSKKEVRGPKTPLSSRSHSNNAQRRGTNEHKRRETKKGRKSRHEP